MNACGAQTKDMSLEPYRAHVEHTSTGGIACKVSEIDYGAVGEGVKQRALFETEGRRRVLPREEEEGEYDEYVVVVRSKHSHGDNKGSGGPRRGDDGSVLSGKEDSALEPVYHLAGVAEIGRVVVHVINTKYDWKGG